MQQTIIILIVLAVIILITLTYIAVINAIKISCYEGENQAEGRSKKAKVVNLPDRNEQTCSDQYDEHFGETPLVSNVL